MRILLRSNRTQVTEQLHISESGGDKGSGTCISDEPAFPGVRPQCPRCRANIDRLECQFCGFQMFVKSVIVCALPPNRAAHYARFIEDYERIRAEEGRGSKKDDFYLCLPYKDVLERIARSGRLELIATTN